MSPPTPPDGPPEARAPGEGAASPWGGRRRELLLTLVALPVLLGLGLLAGQAVSPGGAATRDSAVTATGSSPTQAPPATGLPSDGRPTGLPQPPGPVLPSGPAAPAPGTTGPSSTGPTPPARGGASGPGPSGPIPLPREGTSIAWHRGVVTPDLRVWQSQMAERGWRLGADGVFGAQTERVLRAFQDEKGLVVDGVLGVQSWTRAWTAPLS